MMTRRRLLRTLPLAALAWTGCEAPLPPPRYKLPRKPLSVITTTVQAADLLRHVGGEAVNVRSLIPPGINPHLWQPTAAEIASIQISDAFFLSGLGLEERFSLNLDTLRSRGLFVGVLANGLDDAEIRLLPDGKRDPHFWMDLRLWVKACRVAADVLSEACPAATAWFADRSHEYSTDLAHEYDIISRRFAETPARSRFLLTSHDTMGYFANAYGLQVRSLANAAGEAPSKTAPGLISWMEEHHIRTLFRESIADPKVIKTLARPLNLSADPQIFSLSLASAGTRLPGVVSELAVDEFLPAQRYTAGEILIRAVGE